MSAIRKLKGKFLYLLTIVLFYFHQNNDRHSSYVCVQKIFLNPQPDKTWVHTFFFHDHRKNRREHFRKICSTFSLFLN
jgi:hypothetical protein